MSYYTKCRWLALLAVFAICACATIDEPEQTGFLSDYSKLVRDDDDQWLFAEAKTAEYSKFLIEPVSILIDREGEAKFKPEEIEELKAHFVDKMTSALTKDDGYEVVSEPGPGVASFRLAITEVDASIAALNITIYTKVSGAGLGGIAAEGEIVDSMTGEQLAAAIRWGTGSRVMRAGLSKLGDAKLVIDKWAADIRKRIDQAHAHTS